MSDELDGWNRIQEPFDLGGTSPESLKFGTAYPRVEVGRALQRLRVVGLERRPDGSYAGQEIDGRMRVRIAKHGERWYLAFDPPEGLLTPEVSQLGRQMSYHPAKRRDAAREPNVAAARTVPPRRGTTERPVLAVTRRRSLFFKVCSLVAVVAVSVHVVSLVLSGGRTASAGILAAAGLFLVVAVGVRVILRQALRRPSERLADQMRVVLFLLVGVAMLGYFSGLSS